jgi:hypothetical protein
MMVQVAPFHRSISGFVPKPSPELPTAKHLVAAGHATPVNTLKGTPLTLGLAMIDQLVPVQRSTNVLVADPESS